MDFDFLDRYLLEEMPAKREVVKELLKRRCDVPGAAPFYQGIEMLGAKTPDLTLIALRLVLAGKKADDSRVMRVRELVEQTRAKGSGRQAAIASYYEELG